VFTLHNVYPQHGSETLNIDSTVCTGISLPTRYGAGIPGQQLSTRIRCHVSATLTGLMVSLVLTRVDYCNSVLTGLPLSQLNRLQAQLISSSRDVDATISLRCSSSFIGCSTDCTCHPLFNTRRRSIPCRRCSRLKCSAAFSVICLDTPYFQTTYKDTSFPTQFLVLVFISF